MRILHGLKPLHDGRFANGLISRIFSVFWSGFLHRTTVNDL